MVAGVLGAPGSLASPRQLATAIVQSPGAVESASFDGVVEAVRQTVVAAQVSGAVIAVEVKAGDVVKTGQVLARIDARTAEQNVAASDAQVQSARATLEVAIKEYDRQTQLFERNFTSRAALERAEAQFKATQAQVSAQLAEAGAARAQSGFFVIKAPYGGVIAEVPITLGDMAMPGRALFTIYDPAAIRVTAAIPQTDIARFAPGSPARIQIPGAPAERQWVAPANMTVLPTADPGTHTAQVRLDLPAAAGNVTPGTFARVLLPLRGTALPRLHVPASAIVRRAEMTGVYVLDGLGHPILRQVRLGRAGLDTVEVLSGVSEGERVALDPQAAARER
ncbi:MAG: efflux RND transporter periplasmic adaptor subunit [Casimicrobiaceae bacterium]